MSNKIHFEIQRGSVVSDCMEDTYDFISENLKYLHNALVPVRDEILEANNFSFVCYEDNWTFAVKIERVELGKVASGSGVIQDGNRCYYDELLETLS